ncbi:MAG: phenylalanine--tRNA ligase subunit beta [Planctomycetaceae bacterium]|nr:phenylalanine--tRNA ligase subunit beta [Planctomycetaceae bacterium]
MLISYEWLKSLVPLGNLSVDEFARRMMMAGFNHESTTPAGDDYCVDLEITSNRPDCLGHIGLAREAAVIFGSTLKPPAAAPVESAAKVGESTSVAVECPQLCPRYTARVIRGVKVGPSPAWLQKRLAAIGQPTINNVVDITNYVLMETGQPLHAFDLAKLSGRKIIVREAKAGEKFEAINHKTYTLEPGMCVIADAERPVALGGVMGGADSEVFDATTEVLIESAAFDPLSIRTTARKLALRSDSSYRFERGVDVENADWVSRRCCELILEICGGELMSGAIDVAAPRKPREPITLRAAQIQRIVGIEIPADEVRRIILALGLKEAAAQSYAPPSWRRDLEREIDLIEEVARIYGYDKIPEDVGVPMAPSARTDEDRVLAKVRQVLTACGFDEALTISVVDDQLSQSFSPWSDAAPLALQMPILERADKLRRSLVPSLLKARRDNEAVGNRTIELFETAKVYLPRAGQLPQEELMLGLTAGGDGADSFFRVKGTLEAVLAALDPTARLEVRPTKQELLAAGRGVELLLNGETIGVLGEVAAAALKKFELRGKSIVAELKLGALVKAAVLVPQYAPLPAYPSIERDINLVVDETVRWSDLASAVQTCGAGLVESFALKGEPFRDEKKLGAGKKSLLVTLTLRSAERTLTNAEADDLRARIVDECAKKFGATLRA